MAAGSIAGPEHELQDKLYARCDMVGRGRTGWFYSLKAASCLCHGHRGIFQARVVQRTELVTHPATSAARPNHARTREWRALPEPAASLE
jgi:hypothetical protein